MFIRLTYNNLQKKKSRHINILFFSVLYNVKVLIFFCNLTLGTIFCFKACGKLMHSSFLKINEILKTVFKIVTMEVLNKTLMFQHTLLVLLQ